MLFDTFSRNKTIGFYNERLSKPINPYIKGKTVTAQNLFCHAHLKGVYVKEEYATKGVKKLFPCWKLLQRVVGKKWTD